MTNSINEETNITLLILGGIASLITIAFFLKKTHEKYKESLVGFIQSFYSYKKFGIKRIARTRTKAIKIIWEDLLESNNIKVLNYKGYSLLYEKNLHSTLLYKLREESKRLNSVDFLLLHPEADSIIKDRRKNLEAVINLEYESSSDDSFDDIINSIKALKKLNRDKTRRLICNCRLFQENLKWSLMISANYILVGFYPKDIIALNSRCLILYRNSILGNSFEKYFNELWDKSTDGYEYMSNKGIN